MSNYTPPPAPQFGPPPPYAPRPPKPTNWFDRHKVWTAVIVGVGVIVIVGAVTAPGTDTAGEETTSQVRSDAPAKPVEQNSVDKPKPEPKDEPVETVSQANARATAEDYLSYTAFSRSGLIGQLEFEGYSNTDARYAVAHVDVDWNEQAARSAQQYLDYTSFSRAGLIDQLVYEGYTHRQAAYGVAQTGL